ncbi:short-subunit dehydrogenase involved in D-alanine esterification of teichoic acids [Glaciihabitans tibetensis]|uniref:Short-subunit dehydrogenase involved in D-alanine esterification of teichoic acids n=1 Tax=Glaciihabitans tibetensis TaxID=1266600 RepID=A0A2T0V6T1_9MICO|nr:SDR family NAD(P)-dependent oxidoreductase [Glaciihabitans tibetensis]PRY65854.1 short-subunit dehydrogenase involved in D-alanine esterification of teichoic acids [Glaciihabitans tibetensis]
MNISGNTIFIPGGTSGLGLGLALRLHAAGNTVIIAGRRAELLESITRDHPGIESIALDTTDPAAVVRVSREVQERWPATNVLITMAGIMQVEDVTSAGFLATAEATVVTNVLGPIRLIAAFSEFLAGQPDATIMTVSSGLASVPLPITPTYNATKAAIHSFSESLRVQLADTTVRVIELVPPAVQTTLMGQQDDPGAMPLEEYLDETMALLEAQPDAREILVERVKYLRNATVEGRYDDVLAVLSGAAH